MTKVRLEREDNIGVVVIDNPPVNAGSAAVRQGLLECIASVDKDPTLRAGVLIGFGKTFISGSDLKEFDLPLDPPQLPQVIEAIELSAKPWIAALHGAALGGGFELALGCDTRLALSGTVVGLPECGLGMIPGAGGIQRLTRLIGRVRAIDLITSSRRIEALEAAAFGMIDEICAGDLREAAVDAAKALHSKRRLVEKPVPPEHENEIFAAEQRAAIAGRKRPHILSAIRHIEAVGNLPFNEGLLAERQDFQKFRISPDARAYRSIFFAERAAGRVDVDIKAKTPSKIGIIGSGEAAYSIALSGVLAGQQVMLFELDGKTSSAMEDEIQAAPHKKVSEANPASASVESALTRLSVVYEISSLSECGVVIESMDGNLDARKSALSRFGPHFNADALIASATGDDAEALSSFVNNAERMIGLHFLNPRDPEGVVEVVKTTMSSARSIAEGVAVARAFGHKAVIVRNVPGFAGNRIFAAYRNACEAMVAEGMSAVDVDNALVDFGFTHGPLGAVNGHAFAKNNMTGPMISARDIQRQALTAMVNEAERVLAEGVAEKPGDIDVIMVNAFGFPRWFGGPLHWATSEGASGILKKTSQRT
ncbi:enoyl-CoA hydratase-related protein [Agrobacterium sp. T29]|uniref:enoyl-CoA hydratase-related protein n=1 Tax=Agrobacterium sp. T29 TaxID=2580515 RepID=UPI00115DA47C|nr:enoyl-CoA hydratase-related protein [Agrobacterium sp. T29]